MRVKIHNALEETLEKYIIFFGHVPLIECKTKKGNDILKLCNDSDTIFKDIFLSDLLINMQESHGVKIYYICADTHFYQEADILFDNGLKVTQYIVGTGGAELDDPAVNDCLSEPPSWRLPTQTRLAMSPIISDFVIKKTIKTNGYLRCEVTEHGLNTEFIDVAGDKLGRSGSKKSKLKKTKHSKKLSGKKSSRKKAKKKSKKKSNKGKSKKNLK